MLGIKIAFFMISLFGSLIFGLSILIKAIRNHEISAGFFVALSAFLTILISVLVFMK